MSVAGGAPAHLSFQAGLLVLKQALVDVVLLWCDLI